MKNLYSLIAGIITGVVLVALLELLLSVIYPIPKGLDMNNADTKEILMLMMPLGAMILLLVNYAVASFAGGLVSALISKKVWQSLVIGSLLTVGNIFNLMELPHPLCLAITSMLMFLPFAFLGGKVGMRIKNNSNLNAN